MLSLPTVSFSRISLPHAPHAPVRASRLDSDGKQTIVLVVRDLADALDYAEHKMNLLLRPTTMRRALANPMTVRSAENGMAVRVVTADEAKAMTDYIAANRAIAQQFGRPATMAERDLRATAGLPVFRVGPFTMDGHVYPALDVPAVLRAPDGQPLIRAKEFVRALNLSRPAAASRLAACMEPSKNYSAGEPPHFHQLWTQRQLVQFGRPAALGEGSGKPTAVWPVELAPLLFEALARGRPRGKPSADAPHHATALARASGLYRAVTAPAAVRLDVAPSAGGG